MKSHILAACLWALTLASCATHETVALEKLKKNERLYIGQVYVEFNGQKNGDSSAPRCDLFLKSSVGAEFKTSPSGFVTFKEKSKDVRLGEIACIYEHGREKSWVHYPIQFKAVPKSENKDEVTYFGDVYVTWTLTPEDFGNTEYKAGFASDKKIMEKGEFSISVKDNFEAVQQKFKETYPEFKEASLRKALFEVVR